MKNKISGDMSKTTIDELYRQLYRAYHQKVGEIDYALENPAVTKIIKRKKISTHKVFSMKGHTKVIDLATTEEIIVEMSSEKSPNDFEVAMGKTVLYNTSLDIGDRICSYYNKNQEQIKDIRDSWNVIMASVATLNWPTSVAGIFCSIIAKIGLERYCKNRRKIQTKSIVRK